MNENPIVGVCGFGRCGSSMIMQMLAAGGLPWADGAASVSGEHQSISHAFASARPGAAVKLLDLRLAAQYGESVERLSVGAWQLVWLDRNPRWQAESFRKFTRHMLGEKLTVRQTRAFRESLIRDRDASVDWLRSLGHPVCVLSFEDLIADPTGGADVLAAFLPWADLDAAAMASVVHVRSPRTLPDMAVEARSA